MTRNPRSTSADCRESSGLRADCERCCGLCCVAPGFSASADFAIDKAAGEPCPHLGSAFRCSIHRQLATRGFLGCVAYDCYGAGQKVTQLTYQGRDWQQSPEIAEQMYAVFMVMRQLHELLMYLDEARKLKAVRTLDEELRDAFETLESITEQSPEALLEVDVSVHKREVNELLLQVSALVRSNEPESGRRELEIS